LWLKYKKQGVVSESFLPCLNQDSFALTDIIIQIYDFFLDCAIFINIKKKLNEEFIYYK